MERFWIPHKDHAFVPCFLEKSEGGNNVYESCDGTVSGLSLPASQAASLSRVYDSQTAGVDDICALDEVNAPSVLHTVRLRYSRNQIYTHVSSVLIAVNPFQYLSIYSSDIIDRYINSSSSAELEPHVFAIGFDATQGLRQARSQAILISGESGAGKTETTKLLLSYMAEALSGSGGIQQQIMQINPVLEAFGNAMTVRNNNSSRFGKWIEVLTSSQMVVNSCSVTDYLLEVTRVCSQGEKERNYHIFFQLICERDKEEFKDLKIMAPEKYEYIKNSTFIAPGVDDKKEFAEVLQALTSLGFEDDVQLEIFKVVTAILTLGNIAFDESDKDAARVKSPEALKEASRLLGISEESLETAISMKRIQVGKEVTFSPLKGELAKAARDGLARLLYGRMFKFLISVINKTLAAEKQDAKNELFLGVLDIAGFESFEHNSLEQLFINLSNEHLQKHFNNHIFKLEIDDYTKEGVSEGIELTYQDNSDVVELIDARGGILQILDEEVSVPKASDQTYVHKVYKAYESHKRFVASKLSSHERFGIRHFAGEVQYSCKGFLEKNIDKPPDAVGNLLASSDLSVLKTISEFVLQEQVAAQNVRRGSAQKKKTVSSAFRDSLGQLFQKLTQASPHFIRCIKPNMDKAPNIFTAPIVMEQLTNAGVMEAVRIRQQGFASRATFEEFLARYKVILPSGATDAIYQTHTDAKARVVALLEALPEVVQDFDPKSIVLGDSKVFAKTAAVSLLDKDRDMAISQYCQTIQRYWKGYWARKQICAVRRLAEELKAWHNTNDFYGAKGSDHTALAKLGTGAAIDTQVSNFSLILERVRKIREEPMPHEAQMKKIQQRMENESKLLQELKFLLGSVEVMEISKALARAQGLEMPSVAEIQTLEKRYAQLKLQIPLRKAMQEALDASNLEQLQDCMSVLKKEGLWTDPEDWIQELQARELPGQIFVDIERLKGMQKKDDEDKQRKEEQEKQIQEDQMKVACSFAPDIEAEEMKIKKEKLKQRVAIMKLSEKEEAEVKAQLAKAASEFDALELESSLLHGTTSGMDPDDLQAYQEIFNKLQTDDFLTEQIDEVVNRIQGPPLDMTVEAFAANVQSSEAPRKSNPHLRKRKSIANSHTPDTQDLLRLKNLILQAERIGTPEDVYADAKPIIQQGLRRRAKSTMRGSVFEKVDLAELNMSEEAFADIKDFANMKSEAKWEGHRRQGLMGMVSKGGDPMHSHSKLDINGSLTNLNRMQNRAATSNFKNVLTWMGDRPAPEVMRRGYASSIVETAKSDRHLADEVYIQTMKQLVDNPSSKSLQLGWSLLLLLCQAVAPSGELEEFVRSFFMRAMCGGQERGEGSEEIVAIAKQCMADLNVTIKAAGPKAEELDGGQDLIPVQVMLIDSSTRKVTIAASSTLAQLGLQVAEQLRVHGAAEFSFFQMIEGIDAHRLLPDTIVLSSLLPKMKSTPKKSILLWKRRFLRVDESLCAGDLMHAKLTYRQALWDYLHYPISEDLAYICSIAAMVLFIDKDHYDKYITEKRLHEAGVLEALLPEYFLRFEKRDKLSHQVLKAFARLQGAACDKSAALPAGPLQRMSQVMSLMQRMRLFGTYCWPCKQIYDVPEDKVSLPEAPPKMCSINPKDPKAQYWICVDLFGIRFLSFDSSPGSEYMRGFLLRDESVERVLRWSARKDVLQIIVQTYSPSEVRKGSIEKGAPVRLPMTVAVECTAAVDIAHTLQCAARERAQSGNKR